MGRGFQVTRPLMAAVAALGFALCASANADVISNSFAIPSSMLGRAAPVVVNAYHERSRPRSEMHGAPIVHVDVKLSDPAPDRVDNEKGDWIVRLTIDPNRLNAAQTAALSEPLPSQRAAAFSLSTAHAATTVRRINADASQLCDDDTMGCEDHVSYEDVAVDTTIIAVSDT